MINVYYKYGKPLPILDPVINQIMKLEQGEAFLGKIIKILVHILIFIQPR